MRYLSWFLSLLVHAGLALALLHAVQERSPELEKLLEVDLTEMEAAEPEPIVKLESLLPPQPEPPVPEAVPEDAPALPAPLSTQKTIVLDDAPAPVPPPAPAPEPVVEPDVVEISPVKTESPAEDKPEKIYVRKDDTVVHRGHEARFGRSMMADYYSYSSTEFSGHFKTRDDRTISIIDARDTKYGRFLIYDSKNKTLRRMKEFAKYVYTIGPSLYEDEPVTGTVTFLAKNDRIERFILTTDEDRLAHYPRKVHVREEEIQLKAPGGELAGLVSLPPSGKDHFGVVFLSGPTCAPVGMVQSVTRALSMKRIASLAFTVAGCVDDGGVADPAADYDGAVRAAVERLAEVPQVGDELVGLWGNGVGAPHAIDVALHPGKIVPAFLVCLLDDSLTPGDMPALDRIALLDIPVLWFITGHETSRWRPLIKRLEGLRDKEDNPFTIVLAPHKDSREVDMAHGEDSGWVEQVTDKHAGVAGSWILHLPKQSSILPDPEVSPSSN